MMPRSQLDNSILLKPSTNQFFNQRHRRISPPMPEQRIPVRRIAIQRPHVELADCAARRLFQTAKDSRRVPNIRYLDYQPSARCQHAADFPQQCSSIPRVSVVCGVVVLLSAAESSSGKGEYAIAASGFAMAAAIALVAAAIGSKNEPGR